MASSLSPGRIRLYKQSNSVLVDWDGTLNTSIEKYQVYRGSTDGEPIRIGTVLTRDNSLAFVDNGVKQGNLYFCYVTTENKYGVESDGSEELSIRM